MRSIGDIGSEKDARLFSDFLYARGIENEVERSSLGTWDVWVVDDDQLVDAEQWLVRFRKDPTDPEIALTAADAPDIRRKAEREDAAAAKLYKTRTDVFRSSTVAGIGRMSLVLMVLSGVVALLSSLGNNPSAIDFLFITTPRFEPSRIAWTAGLPEIMRGEIWRLITPIFIHFGPLHLIFNLLWVKDLGTAIESRYSSRYLLVFTLVVAVLSNLGQYMMSNPLFGGMSGVVYGLLGFLWIRGRVDPTAGFTLHQTTVVMMGVWYVLCLTGWLGNIANTAHTVGLVCGVAWGYISGRRAMNKLIS